MSKKIFEQGLILGMQMASNIQILRGLSLVASSSSPRQTQVSGHVLIDTDLIKSNVIINSITLSEANLLKGVVID